MRKLIEENEGFPTFTSFFLVYVGTSKSELTCPDVDEGKNMYIPSLTNCMEYFHCVHGVPIMMKCPDNLFWDPSKEICNWPDLIDPPCRAGCHSDRWIKRDRVSNCYLFGNETMNFTEAMQFCEANGGKLAEPRRERETNAINRMIKKDAVDDVDKNYWIGLTDIDDEGRFTWLSDDSEVGYNNWNNGEPNNLNDEDCVHLRKGVSFEWNDSKCSNKNRNTALCQKF